MSDSEYRKKVYDIINQKNFSAKKKFSQNFLMDENIINKIVKSAEIDINTCVIEIGPGLGAVSKRIVANAKKAILYEVDNDLIHLLDELLKEYDNYEVINKDFLKVDIDHDIDEYFENPEKLVIVSNLPYHITTPIIMKILEESKKIDAMILMMQYEVAKRITSTPNTKDYNALSLIIQHQTTAKYLFKVPKTVFNPKPNVDSAVIKLTIDKMLKNSNKNYKQFYKFLHNSFSQRRKTLVNNITSTYECISKNDFIELLENHHINEKIRAEALSLEAFTKLYDDFKNICNEEK